MSGEVLLVEDDPAVREALAQTLDLAGFQPWPAGSFVAAKDQITDGFAGVIVTDIRMPGRDGFHLLSYAQAQDPELPVILLTGEGDIPMAVRAMGQGAFDFLEKPCAPKTLLATVERAMTLRRLVLENRSLKIRLSSDDAAARMIPGSSRAAQRYRDRVRAVAAAAGEPVLIAGPTGANAPKIADVVRRLAGRERQPFEKRAASGLSVADLTASFATARGGTLFLDEISALPADTQLALLEHLDRDRETLVIAGTYRDLETFSGFSADLRFRLNAVRVNIPEIRERVADIPELFHYYINEISQRAGLVPPPVPDGYMAELMARDWPGNNQALFNAATQFVLGLESPVVVEELGLAEHLAQVEKTLLVRALQRHNGQASAAAKDLKLPRKTFYDKLARHSLRPEAYR